MPSIDDRPDRIGGLSFKTFQDVLSIYDTLQLDNIGNVSRRLGVMAVDTAIVEAFHDIVPTPEDDHQPSLLQEELSSIRDDLYTAMEDRPERMRSLIQADAMPAWLRAAIGIKPDKKEAEESVVEILIKKDDEDEYAVPDATFLNVLEWHNQRIVDRQKTFTADELPQLRSDYETNLSRAISSGWLTNPRTGRHYDILNSRRHRLDAVTVHLYDESARAGNHTGYILFSEKGKWPDVYLLHHLTGQQLKRSYNHELTHLLDGTPLNAGEVPQDSSINYLFGGRHSVGNRAIEEAVVTHLTDSLLGSDIDETRFWKQSRQAVGTINSIALYTLRDSQPDSQLLNILSREGVSRVDIRLFITAMFESPDQRDQFGDESASKALSEALREAFPFADVIEEIKQLKITPELPTNDDVIRDYNVRLLQRTKQYNRLYRKIGRSITRRKAPTEVNC